jgi:hypothetical protein
VDSPDSIFSMLGQRLGPRRTRQCRSPQVLSSICHGRVRGRIQSRNQITHLREFLRHRSQFRPIASLQRSGEPGRNTNTRTFHDGCKLAQTVGARTLAELRQPHVASRSRCAGSLSPTSAPTPWFLDRPDSSTGDCTP